MTAAMNAATVLRQFGGMEWVIFLIVVAVLLLFGPAKLPEMARAVGRAWGEFRKGRMEVEREIRQEFMTEPSSVEATASRDQILRAAKDLAIMTEGRDMKDVKLDVAKAIDRVDSSRVISTAKAFGLPIEGVGVQALKEQIIRRLAV